MRLYADFETYWAKDYTLKDLTPPEYILDPRFQVHGCAFQWGEGEPFWLDGHQLPKFFGELPSDTVLVTFNALFDASIVYWRYDFLPALMLDAMGAARACIGPNSLPSFSLDSVAKHLGLGAKSSSNVANTKGVRTENMPTEMYNELVAYAKHDVALTKKIFERLEHQFPQSEIRFMDLVLRCAVTPQLELDAMVLAEHIADIQHKKEQALAEAGCTRMELMSADKFKALLESHGVDVETKPSPSGGLPIPALARTDEFMQKLYYEHTDPKVQALVAARLSYKSTIEETRAKRLYNIAMLPWDSIRGPQPRAPIPLRYAGAHTHRLSGEWQINLQNLPRGSKLRHALRAPPGCKVISADLAQIEARLGAYFANEETLLDLFAQKLDPYCELATYVFGRPITKADKLERFIGKTAILGLGYGAGHVKFHKMVHQQARTALGHAIEFTEDFSRKIVRDYRDKLFPYIPARWKTFDMFVLPSLADSKRGSVEMPCATYAQGGHIVLPNGLRLCYNIKLNPQGEYENIVRGFPQKIYGAKLMENVVQALARVVLSDAALRLQALGLNFCMQVHDELVFVVPEQWDAVAELIRDEMIRSPDWAPNLPLDVDIHVGDTYGDCK